MDMSALRVRLRTEAKDLVELLILPGLAAVLPWRLCFKLFRWMSGWSFLYREQCERALSEARARGWTGGDPASWLRARRLVTLVDHADLFLARTRSDRWLLRHVSVEGAWPEADKPAVLCTFHWGAGMWGLRSVGAAGLRAHALVAAVRPEHYVGHSLAYRYTLARNAQVAHALGRPPLDVSASLRPALRALRAGEQVLAAVDVPADQVSASESIDFLGMRASVPRGLLRVAAEQALPVVVFVTGVDLNDGRRFVRIRPVPNSGDPAKLIRDVFAHLESVVREDSAAWHFWSVAERFFERTERSLS